MIPIGQLSYWMAIIIKYKYLVLFSALMIEGPVVTLIAGFLSSPAGNEILSVRFLFAIVFLADIAGDTMYYSIGRFGRRSIGPWFTKIAEKRNISLHSLEEYFHNHGKKTLALGKISHGLGWPVMLAAGSVRMPYGTFMSVNIVVSLFKSAVLVALCYFYGESFERITGPLARVGFIGTTILVVVIITYSVVMRRKKV